MIGGGLAALPNALVEGLPHAPASATPVLALALLAFAGTVGPFALFAYGQSRVAPELAGAFLNLEPLVGTAAGALAFGDPFGPLQLLGRRGDPRRHRALARRRGVVAPHLAGGIPHPQTQGGRLGAPAPGGASWSNARTPPDPRRQRHATRRPPLVVRRMRRGAAHRT